MPRALMPAVKLRSVTTASIGLVIAMMTGCSPPSVAPGHKRERGLDVRTLGPVTLSRTPMLPSGPVAFVAQFNAVGTVSQEECNDDDCDDPRYVVISSSAPTSVQCSFAGENPGTVVATCSIQLAYPYPADCSEEDVGQCDYAVGVEPVWGPESATVDASGQYALTFGSPSSEPWETGANFTGVLEGGSLAVDISGSTSSSTTTATGQGPLAPSGTTPVDGCDIGGTTYESGAVNPANPCQVCTPSLSYGAWSFVPLPDWNVATAGPAPAAYYGVCGGQCVNTETYQPRPPVAHFAATSASIR